MRAIRRLRRERAWRWWLPAAEWAQIGNRRKGNRKRETGEEMQKMVRRESGCRRSAMFPCGFQLQNGNPRKALLYDFSPPNRPKASSVSAPQGTPQLALFHLLGLGCLQVYSLPKQGVP